MEKIIENDKIYLVGYHTQEFRPKELNYPICCEARNAWLGMGFYFWTEEEFAHYWGQDWKMNTGAYDIYHAEIDISKSINAVFSEEGYFFFREKIEEAISYFRDKGQSVTLQKVHRFLADNIWHKLGVTGIIYDDKPSNRIDKNRYYSEIPDLYYKKRIQIVIFSLENIRNFELFLEEQS